jgi:hypothetical protein
MSALYNRGSALLKVQKALALLRDAPGDDNLQKSMCRSSDLPLGCLRNMLRSGIYVIVQTLCP